MIESLLGGKFFQNPKHINLMKNLTTYTTIKDDLILDFFCGSASTAHGIMSACAEDGFNRNFIMVQIAEPIARESSAFKACYSTIADISKERIRRAGKKILEGECHEGWNKDIGFRVLKVDTSNMADVYYTSNTLDQADLDQSINNLKPDRTPEDLLFQVMLEWGIDLTSPISVESLHGKEVFLVGGNALVACFDASGSIDESLVGELAKYQPLRVVFRDAGFKDDATKINVEQVFKLLSPSTEIRCI
jgi:adenine-specific DNA-methyltransferase